MTTLSTMKALGTVAALYTVTVLCMMTVLSAVSVLVCRRVHASENFRTNKIYNIFIHLNERNSQDDPKEELLFTIENERLRGGDGR
jgi:hypothetical protein